MKLPDGNAVEGTGFLTDEPGLVLTNAHVLGMLDPDSRRPLQVDVTLNSGETDSRGDASTRTGGRSLCAAGACGDETGPHAGTSDATTPSHHRRFMRTSARW